MLPFLHKNISNKIIKAEIKKINSPDCDWQGVHEQVVKWGQGHHVLHHHDHFDETKGIW